jgi:hypothetical protein
MRYTDDLTAFTTTTASAYSLYRRIQIYAEETLKDTLERCHPYLMISSHQGSDKEQILALPI